MMLRRITYRPGVSPAALLVATCLSLATPQAEAAFGSFMPLSWSGKLGYQYSYAASQGTESETTALVAGVHASGYMWRPWFATTSLAMDLGFSNTETTVSSSDATSVTGDFNLGVFPRSRFPFSLTYSRSDSRSQSYQDLTQASGETALTITRWTLRQRYQPRRGNQQYNAWYYLTEFDGEGIASESTSYGLDYQLRHNKQSLTASLTHSTSGVSGSNTKPTSDIFAISHVYAPSTDIGVNTLGSYVETDAGDSGGVTKDGQAASSFYWRPEHRSLNVSGGVRLSELRSEGVTDSTTRSLNTSLGFGYRLSRVLNFLANATLGTSDSGDSQSLNTTQGVGLSYAGSHYEFSGFAYSWSWGLSASNSTSRNDTMGTVRESDQQSVGGNIGHNLSRNWRLGRFMSLNGSFSQSLSASKSSEIDVPTKTINNGVSMSWNRRGRRGATYAGFHASDSHSYSERDTVFQSAGANLVQDLTINRLSGISGNITYDASRSETEKELGGVTTSSSQNINGSLNYHHERPFGVYNLQFSSVLTGGKQLNTDIPTTTLRWDSIFRYSLGLLSTSLSFQFSESAGGNLSKSMNFQATRSF
jgi:hypothetical protein